MAPALTASLVCALFVTASGQDDRRPPTQARPAVVDFSPAIAKYGRSVFLVVANGQGGTGFLIATDPPLVATAAHVLVGVQPRAIVVYMNETGSPSAVRAVHIHRAFGGRTNGEIEIYSPDVALLQIAGVPVDLGPPLPLASPTTAQGVRAHSVASLGFPFYSTADFGRNPPEATMQVGVISRLLDFNRGARSPLGTRWIFEHSLENLPGHSGAPLLLPSGEVVGIRHCFRTVKTTAGNQTVSTTIPYAVRVDALWELLEDLGLARAVQGSPDGLVRLHAKAAQTTRNDVGPAADHLREARLRLTRNDYRGAGETANQAIAAAPEADEPYGARAGIFHAYGVHLSDAMRKPREASRYYRLALEDYDRAIARAPDEIQKTRWRLARGLTECSLTSVGKERPALERVLAFARSVAADEKLQPTHHQAREVAG